MDRVNKKSAFELKLKTFIIIFFIAFQIGLVPASAKTLKIKKEYSGKFTTAVKGISESKPPYVRVIRSKEGVAYLFNKFRKIRKLSTHNKALILERRLLKTNFSSRMIVAVLSQPMDNFKIEKIAIIENKEEQKIDLNVSYFHRNKSYKIPPFKSISYSFYLVKASDLPVVLNAVPSKKKTRKAKKKSLVNVSGTLQNWDNEGTRLALINKQKRKKRVYYIKGTLQEELREHLGKFMTLKGEVVRDSESIYEADFTVKKIVKVY